MKIRWGTMWFLMGLLVCAVIVSAADRDYRLDDELFRRGLIQLGFDDWLELYNEEHLPENDLDLFSEQISGVWLKYNRSKGKEKENALEELLRLERERIANYPDNALVPIWRIRYAMDLLNEKCRYFTFVHLLYLHLPEDYANQFAKVLTEIEGELTLAEKFIKKKEEEFNKLPTSELEKLNKAGLPELYEVANIQIKTIRVWLLYHRMRLVGGNLARRVKLLYKLRDGLEMLRRIVEEASLSPELTVFADVERRLGDRKKARKLIQKASRYVSVKYSLFTELTKILIDIDGGRKSCEKEVENLKSVYLKKYPNNNLIELAFAMIECKAKLKGLSFSKNKVSGRNESLIGLSKCVSNDLRLIWYVLPELIKLSEGVPVELMGDIELLARAEFAFKGGKYPLAENLLKILIKRKTMFKEDALVLLSEVFLKENKLKEAVDVLSSYVLLNEDVGREVIIRAVELAWKDLQVESDKFSKNRFIRLAYRLFEKYPDCDDSDRFKLLVASELAEQGKFWEAIQWTGQILPASRYYLHSKAEKVLILAKRFRYEKQKSTIDVRALRKCAGDILKAVNDLLTIADLSGKSVKSMSEDQREVIGSAVISAIEVLSDENLSADFHLQADKLNRKCDFLIREYEKGSKDAVLLRFYGFLKKSDKISLESALRIANKLLDDETFPLSERVKMSVDFLNTVYWWWIKNYPANTRKEDRIVLLSAEFSGKLIKAIKAKSGIMESLSKILILRFLILVEAGKTDLAEKMSLPEKSIEYKNWIVDVKLAKARVMYLKGQYVSAVRLSMDIVANLSPKDIRYWQGLIINLDSHIKIGSDRKQIKSAILMRKLEYPELGGKVMREELEAILSKCQ